MQLVIIAGEKEKNSDIDYRAVIEHQIELAKGCGIDEVFILSERLASEMKENFGDGEDFGVKIYHVVVPYKLGTGGCLKLIQDRLTDRFMVLLGNVPEGFDIASFVEFDRGCNSIGTIAVRERVSGEERFSLRLGASGEVERFYSGIRWDEDSCGEFVSAQMYIFSVRIFKYIWTGFLQDLDKHVLPEAVNKDEILMGYRVVGLEMNKNTIGGIN